MLPAKASSSYSPPNSMLIRMWNVPTSPKVGIFMWKVVKNWIACKANLFKRKCSPSPLCPICNEKDGTVEHILFHCPWRKPVWFGSGKSFWILEGLNTTADRWMEDLLCENLAKESPMEEVATIFQICWAIWKARNAFVFEGKPLKLQETIDSAFGASSDYLRALFMVPKVNPVKANRDKRWVPPPSSVIKFNCDGAYNFSRSLTHD